MKESENWEMFDLIAPTYDRANHILSFNIDIKWRNRVADFAPKHPFTLVDLATGTGDLLLSLLNNCPQIIKSTGIDLSIEMLKIAEKKTINSGHKKTTMVVGNAMKIFLPKNYCEMVTMGFGIRNTKNPLKVLQEVHRILKKNGTAVILEFSLPKNILINFFFLFYFRYFLPLIGGLISKNFQAYRYLNQSVENFPYGKEFTQKMKEANFSNIEIYPLTFGIATLYVGKKLK